MDLLCSTFMKINPLRDSKNGILVLPNAFSKLSQAFVTTHQKEITISKILMDTWFHVYSILA